MAGRNIDEKLRCSFCNKTQDQVKKLIAGHNGVYICDECVEICSDILDEEFETEADEKEVVDGMNINLLKPKQIKEFLDDYVIGQDDAKIGKIVLYDCTLQDCLPVVPCWQVI